MHKISPYADTNYCNSEILLLSLLNTLAQYILMFQNLSRMKQIMHKNSNMPAAIAGLIYF